MKKLLIIFFSFWGLFIGKVFSQQSESFTLQFDHNNLSCSVVTADDGQTYSLLSYPDCDVSVDLGNPSLPLKYLKLLLPYNAIDIDLTLDIGSKSTHFLPAKIFPIQAVKPDIIGDYEDIFYACNDSVYNLESAYPSIEARIVGISSVGQENKIVTIAVCPVIYYPKNNMYDFISDITVSLQYSQNMKQYSGRLGSPSLIDIGLPFYEYCVITKRNLADSFSRLVSWRRQQGIDAGVVCIEDILSNYYVTSGDTASSINDGAGKLRQYLRYAYESGKTTSVLLGGDYSIIPIRYGMGNDFETSTFNTIPSDMYYCELESDWNQDDDDRYGEPNDGINYGGQISVGRLLCKGEEDIINYTDKLLWYEMNPGNGACDYLKRALYTRADHFCYDGDFNIVIDSLRTIFQIDTLLSEFPSGYSVNPTFPYGHDVINAMNEQTYGFASWYGHGHPNAISTLTSGNNHDPHYGIFSVEVPVNGEDSIPYMQRAEGNGLNMVSNKEFPMVAYTVACLTAPLDVYDYKYAQYPNMGQSFTNGKGYGGPIYIGYSRNGYSPFSYRLQKRIVSYLKEYPVGEAIRRGKADVCSSGGLYHYLGHSLNLIGCPNIRIWTDTPYMFDLSPIYIGDNIQLNGNLIAYKTSVGVRDVTSANDSTYTIITPSTPIVNIIDGANSLLTVTGKNCLPQILPLKLQNTSIHGKHYVLVKEMYSGSNVRSGSNGNVVFESDADYEIEYSGSVTLAAGTEIKMGASVNISPSTINY